MLTLILLLACHRHDDDLQGFTARDRAPGARAPLTAPCDDNDETACLLPWPSSRYLAADGARVTGVRVQVETSSIEVADDPALLNVADGFSRISGIATGFEQRLDPATLDGQLLLLVAEPQDPDYGAEVPLSVEVAQGGGSMAPRDLVIGRPLRPMPANAEMVAVVLDGLTEEGGGALEASRATRVALGLVEPESQEEADWRAYNAPTRSLLEGAGVDVSRVLRVWDFVTRSEDDPGQRLEAIHAADLAALDAGAVSVEIDEVELDPARDIAAIVKGRLIGLPEFRDEDGLFVLDEAGLPAALSDGREAPFRVVIPKGEGDYEVALYGHGTGGNVDDDAFDDESAAAGIAKVGTQWEGWTDATVFTTFGRVCNAALEGSSASTAGLVSSVANVRAVLAALDGVLGDALSADTLGDEENPAAGRRPDTREPLWMGGSLGGTMGAVVLLSEERVHYAVLNVAGGGWTHFIPPSSTYAMLEGVLQAAYEDPFGAAFGLLMTQTAWDDADGAAWGGLPEGDMALVQASIGDPILPNVGSEILTASLNGVLLTPSVYEVAVLGQAEQVSSGAALEQYKVPEDEDDLGKHGFAARDTPAGDAAMQQIFEYFQSALAGEPVIAHAAACVADNKDGNCDYSEAW